MVDVTDRMRSISHPRPGDLPVASARVSSYGAGLMVSVRSTLTHSRALRPGTPRMQIGVPHDAAPGSPAQPAD